MHELENVISQQIVFVNIVGFELRKHFSIDFRQFRRLFVRQKNDGATARFKERIFPEDGKLAEKRFGKNAEKSRLVFIDRFPFVRNMRVGEKQRVFFDLDGFVGVMQPDFAGDEADLVEIFAAVRQRFGARTRKLVELENIEMPDLFLQIRRHPIHFLAIKIFDRVRFFHFFHLTKFKLTGYLKYKEFRGAMQIISHEWHEYHELFLKIYS
jgi:hypothetical protein